jgi:hypothetical protein
MVYGHLHIPRVTVHDGVPFVEVSLGYPREWRRRGLPQPLLRPVLGDHAPGGAAATSVVGGGMLASRTGAGGTTGRSTAGGMATGGTAASGAG